MHRLKEEEGIKTTHSKFFLEILFCISTKTKVSFMKIRKRIVLLTFIVNYLPLNLTKMSNSRADNSKTSMVTPIFSLKMFLLSYFNNMPSLKKFY
jgi:hypothetical protein